MALDLVQNAKIESEFFSRERISLKERRIQNQQDPFPWKRAVLGTTIRPNFDGCVICNSEDFDSIKLYCESCENCVHIDCVGEKENKLKHEMNEEDNLEPTWTCRVCCIQNSLIKNVEKDGTQLPEIDFRPECCVCKL